MHTISNNYQASESEFTSIIIDKFGGCHLTWEFSEYPEEELNKRIARLKYDLEVEPTFRCFQIKNILGYCNYKLGKNIEAKNIFTSILKESKRHNLNALKNLAYCAFVEKDYQLFAELKDELNKLDTPSDINHQKTIHVRKAEYLSEKSSFYGTFDQHMKQDCTLGIRIRREALKIGGEDWERENLFTCCEARFGLAFDLARLDNKCVYEKNDTDMYYEQAAKKFHEFTKIKIPKENEQIRDIKVMQSKAWAYLADLGNRKKSRSLKTTLELQDDLETKDCLINALSPGVDSVAVKGLVAEQYRRSKWYDMALKLFDESLPEGNKGRWWNRHRRGKVYLDRYEKYKKEKEDASQPQDTPNSDKELQKAEDNFQEAKKDLKKAKKDFRICHKTQGSTVPYILLDLAYIYYYQEKYDKSLKLCDDYMKSVEILEYQDIDDEIKRVTKLYELCCKAKAHVRIETGLNQSDTSSTRSLTNPAVIFIYEESSAEWVEKEKEFMQKVNPEKMNNLDVNDVLVDSHKKCLKRIIESLHSSYESNAKKCILVLTDNLINYDWFKKMVGEDVMIKKMNEHCILPILHKTSEEIEKDLPSNLKILSENSKDDKHRVCLCELLTLPTTYTKRCVLLVGDEWGTAKGGISTMNQSLAEILSKESFIVYSTAVCPSKEDEEEAKSKKVTLVPLNVPSLSWLEIENDVSFPKLLKIARMVDIVIGHSLVLANASIMIHKTIQRMNPNAKLYMFNHVISEIEIFKDTSTPMKLEEKEKKMLDAAKEADVLFSVGPLIYDRQQQLFNSLDTEKKHEIFLPKPVNIFFEKEWKATDNCETIKSVISYGRIREVYKLKGYDIAAAAMGLVAESFTDVEKCPPIWEIRGISEENWKEQTEKLEQDIRSRYVLTKALVFTNQKKVIEHLQRCHLVLMTSRLEPFGLVALEAMALGIPVLINEHSGLAKFILNDKDLSVFASHCIVKGTSLSKNEESNDNDAKLWAKHIKRILLNMRVAKILANELKNTLKESKTIKKSHANFIELCRNPPE